LIAQRRRRESREPPALAAHGSAIECESRGPLQYETDRARFLGRGQALREALAITDPRTLSNSVGTVLDPVLSLRRRIRIQPGAQARLLFWTAAAADRDCLLATANAYTTLGAALAVRAAALERAVAARAAFGLDPAQASIAQRLAGLCLYRGERTAHPPGAAAGGDPAPEPHGGPPALWACGLSGDRPIVLARARRASDLAAALRLERLRHYLEWLRCPLDVVHLTEETDLDEHFRGALAAAQPASDATTPARVLASASLSSASRSMLWGAASLVLETPADLEAALRTPRSDPVPLRPEHRPAAVAQTPGEPLRPRPSLEFFNGIGGFAAGGHEYFIVLDAGERTPAPWVNVLTNGDFGTLVSADGIGSSWAVNARENQITPWGNDCVTNAPSEVVYLADESRGELWSTTPLPVPDANASYRVRHGWGFTRYEHASRGIEIEQTQFVPLDAPLKLTRLKLTNPGEAARTLTLTYYLDWVLGAQRQKTAPFIVTERDGNGALLARNAWSMGFESQVAFMDLGIPADADAPEPAAAAHPAITRASGDRREFLGPHGSLAAPAALFGTGLSNRVGAGLDPCGALQRRLVLAPGQTIEVRLILGRAASRDEARALLTRWRVEDFDAALKRVTDFWDATLGAVQVKTPDRAMDLLLNGWLLYQTVSSRLWGRTGFYQTSGAWGYRDQLQDVMAVCGVLPTLAREHILRAAGRQFMEGDVQHWWLPVSGAGVRTRVADDRIWLPYVLVHYLRTTGDTAILDEPVPYLRGASLEPAQLDAFYVPETAGQGSLYEHCVRALDTSLALGSHGLPLFGSGDWNDGMNRVGVGGRGESVWLGWFLHATLLQFAEIAAARGDQERAGRWRKHAFTLKQAIEREAWDGDWYRRGYYDDGTPLGSVTNEECRIDSIAQSWAVISGAADPERAQRAMAAVNAELVSRSDGLIHLFTPPFDRSSHDPGYVMAYPPGLRENGGQYTHAALWTALAFALQGDGDRAHELFSLLNPINHSSTRAAIHRYRVEPYVVCADIYSAPGHVGRGGWTWYTGSAGWMYRTGLEGILGLHRLDGRLRVSPCIPRAWNGFEITVKHGASRYHLVIENPNRVNRGIVRAALDEREIPSDPCDIELRDDGSYHFVRITLG